MPSDPRNLSVAIAHEHYPARGGGEVVADALAETFDAPVITGWIRDRSLSEADDVTELLAHSPARVLRRWMGNPLVRDAFYMFAFESAPCLREYDVVIQSGNAPTWYVPEQHQTVVKYNHSPPRNPFDLFWRESSETADWHDLVSPAYVVDRLYKKATRHLWKNRTDAVDLWVCNSETVAHRTQKFLGIDRDRIRVVYPPVDVDVEYRDGGDHYLFLSRLAPSKHAREAIAAFEQLPHQQLVVAGDGRCRDAVEAQAAGMPNVDVRGYVAEPEKRRLLRDAKALVFLAENEDFGMVPVEAMAAGTPVIGVEEGFTAEQIRDGVNGYFTDRKPSEVQATIWWFEDEGVEWSGAQLHAFAQQFGRERFEREMRAAVEAARERNRYTSSIDFTIAEIGDDEPRCFECGATLGEGWRQADAQAKENENHPADCLECGENPLPPVGDGDA
jgi:glycosyltransferase involved in cell wall biosynthesis